MIYLALGSNLGDREKNLKDATSSFAQAGITVLRESSLYETAPTEYTAQPDFLNMVVEAETALFPMQLLKKVHDIERTLGRKRIIDKGPRVIDIDILLYGKFVIQSAALQVPHPRMAQRRFVLEPLAELAPDLRHPVTRKKIRDLLPEVLNQKLRRRD